MNTRQIRSKVCLIIYIFCKSCEPELEPEIVFVLILPTKNNFTTLTKQVNQYCGAVEILKKTWICLVLTYLYLNATLKISEFSKKYFRRLDDVLPIMLKKTA